ncbi:helix-turn-helix domain-containing protein [Leuconostoc pseudomesenteroides]|jgi:transcriptional regulator with XRE-family HTH domain|uniref:helix-turn-helix domain-containing protein n=1 Tax=Leuconostoc pseudomesenteroides TaxID=33968 RepID=UPI0021A6695A|nr:helix-turn-helix domain-containing protein [Leuconostoc pseudomesenteroides]MCT4379759.1 helix-turn-helix domain-containing protein [Leuconostoc pseudomesenteroides]
MSITANRIKELRTQKKLTQQGLADIINSSRGTVAKYEGDERNPSYAMLSLIADALDTTVDYLQGKTDNSLKTPTVNDNGGETEQLTPNQRRVAFSIDPDITDEEREDLIKLFEIAIKNRRRI